MNWNLIIELGQLTWNILFALVSGIAFLWSWSLRRSAADSSSLAQLQAKLQAEDQKIQKGVSALDNRIGRVEERVNHLPTDHDLADLRDSVAKLSAGVSDLAGEQRALVRLVERINQYLMERGK